MTTLLVKIKDSSKVSIYFVVTFVDGAHKNITKKSILLLGLGNCVIARFLFRGIF